MTFPPATIFPSPGELVDLTMLLARGKAWSLWIDPHERKALPSRDAAASLFALGIARGYPYSRFRLVLYATGRIGFDLNGASGHDVVEIWADWAHTHKWPLATPEALLDLLGDNPFTGMDCGEDPGV